jgi:hypothetical protein
MVQLFLSISKIERMPVSNYLLLKLNKQSFRITNHYIKNEFPTYPKLQLNIIGIAYILVSKMSFSFSFL